MVEPGDDNCHGPQGSAQSSPGRCGGRAVLITEVTPVHYCEPVITLIGGLFSSHFNIRPGR